MLALVTQIIEICTICNPMNSSSCSGYEVQLQDFIKENYVGNIIFNNQTIIYPYEIDIYIPELNLYNLHLK